MKKKKLKDRRVSQSSNSQITEPTMKVEATKVKDGFLIPRIGKLKNIKEEKIMLEIEIINQIIDEIDQFFARFNFNLSQLKFDREEANER